MTNSESIVAVGWNRFSLSQVPGKIASGMKIAVDVLKLPADVVPTEARGLIGRGLSWRVDELSQVNCLGLCSLCNRKDQQHSL